MPADNSVNLDFFLFFSFFRHANGRGGHLINTRDELIGSAVGGGRGESERCRRSRCRCVKK